MHAFHAARGQIWGVVFLTMAFLALSVVSQMRYDRVRMEHYDIQAPIHRFVMPAPLVRSMAFGFRAVLADYFWVTAIQDFTKWDRHDSYYPEYFQIISALDPKFEYPYLFGILTVPTRVNVRSLEWLSAIADRGISALPENWQIPYYAGVQEHFIGKSLDKTLRYMQIAMNVGGSPDAVRTAYAIYLIHDTTDYARSRALFSTIYETSQNEETKKIAKERIDLLDFIETMERATAEYKSTLGVYPRNLEDLVEKHFVSLPPEFVAQFHFDIDQTTGKVKFAR